MAKFISKVSNHILCIKPARKQIVDGISVPIPGEHVRFENGSYETEDKEKIEYIRNHRLFGSKIFEEKTARTRGQSAE